MKITIALATSVGVGWLFAVASLASAQDDSLKSALRAVNRRQRDLSYRNTYQGGLRQYHPVDNYEEIDFVPLEKSRGDERKALEKVLLDYLDGDELESNNNNKRFSSSFRERIEADKAHQGEEITDTNDMENNNINNEDYIQSLYDKYKSSYPEFYQRANAYPIETEKRLIASNYYPRLSYDGAGLKKRTEYAQPSPFSEPTYDSINYYPIQSYSIQKQNWDNLPVDTVNENNGKYKYNSNGPYIPQQPIPTFAIAKRGGSSNLLTNHNPALKRIAKSVPKTDPKVENDLSNIFGAPTVLPLDKPKKTIIKKKTTLNPNKMEHDLFTKSKQLNDTDVIKEKIHRKKAHFNFHKHGNPPIKKKSIDWSDYFGYDRKKKNDEDVDNEWLMERYHKAIAMGNKKRSDSSSYFRKGKAEENLEFYPSVLEKKNKNKRNNNDGDGDPGEESDLGKTSTETTPNDVKLSGMDSKLRGIEDKIVGDALKYTGAHEGATDPKEIQDVKDKIISELASAYSIEKMREALDEYRKSITQQRIELKVKNKDDTSKDLMMTEQKRVSVPRKQAVDEERENTPKSDNNIKCTQESEECDEENYKTPTDLVTSQIYLEKECPKLQRACEEVAEVLGKYGRDLEPACITHQACLLCGENSRMVSTRQCNVLFLSKADEICEEDIECQTVAAHSVRYLLDVYQNLKLDSAEECDLICPDNKLLIA